MTKIIPKIDTDSLATRLSRCDELLIKMTEIQRSIEARRKSMMQRANALALSL